MTTPPLTRTATTTARRAPQHNGGLLGLLWLDIFVALRSSFRSAEFAVGAVAIPVLLYAMFGLPNAGSQLPGGGRIGTAMLVSLSAYGVISLAIFTFGEDVAKERGRGWTRTMRATPFPTGLHLVGKSLTAVVHALLIVAAMTALAVTMGGVEESPATWLAFTAIMVGGVLVFSTLGFAIAFLARPRAASVISNLIFLPLAFASGFFVPLSELPPAIGEVARFLPTFHFGQLAYPVMMSASDVATFTGAATQPRWVHLAWVIGSAVVLGTVAVLAARREAVTRRG